MTIAKFRTSLALVLSGLAVLFSSACGVQKTSHRSGSQLPGQDAEFEAGGLLPQAAAPGVTGGTCTGTTCTSGCTGSGPLPTEAPGGSEGGTTETPPPAPTTTTSPGDIQFALWLQPSTERQFYQGPIAYTDPAGCSLRVNDDVATGWVGCGKDCISEAIFYPEGKLDKDGNDKIGVELGWVGVWRDPTDWKKFCPPEDCTELELTGKVIAVEKFERMPTSAKPGTSQVLFKLVDGNKPDRPSILCSVAAPHPELSVWSFGAVKKNETADGECKLAPNKVHSALWTKTCSEPGPTGKKCKVQIFNSKNDMTAAFSKGVSVVTANILSPNGEGTLSFKTPGGDKLTIKLVKDDFVVDSVVCQVGDGPKEDIGDPQSIEESCQSDNLNVTTKIVSKYPDIVNAAEKKTPYSCELSLTKENGEVIKSTLQIDGNWTGRPNPYTSKSTFSLSNQTSGKVTLKLSCDKNTGVVRKSIDVATCRTSSSSTEDVGDPLNIAVNEVCAGQPLTAVAKIKGKNTAAKIAANLKKTRSIHATCGYTTQTDLPNNEMALLLL